MAAAGTGGDLELLATSLARARGEQFFPGLVAHLAVTLDAAETMVCEAVPNGRARTLAVWRAGTSAPNYEYDLEGTPCAVVQAGETMFTELVAGAYRGAPQKYAGYFGMPLTANDGSVLGHLCAYAQHPMQISASGRAVCDILANRAAAELRLVHVKRERALLRAQRRALRAEIAASLDLDDIVGVSAAHLRLVEEMRRAALGSAGVLINGEPGTGKELVARAIHAASARTAKPFAKIDCAALSIDAALNALPQTLALAHGGTVYLDEVGALAPDMQAQLLAALPAQGRAAGGGEVRLLASTNRDLRRLVRAGDFIEELFHRLNAGSIDIPPLRARVEDIPALVQSFVRKRARRLGRRIDSIDPDSLAELTNYAWPGNVRELANLVERALVMQDAPILKISKELLAGTAPTERAALIAAVAGGSGATSRSTLAATLDFDDTSTTGLHFVQREHILRVLNATHWVIEGNSGAALKLGMKPATLRHRMKKLGISRAQNLQGA